MNDRGWAVMVGVVLLAVFGWIAWQAAAPGARASVDRDPSRSGTVSAGPSAATMLAVIDGAPGPPVDHRLLARYERLLAEAVRKTTSDETAIGDCTVRATELLGEAGIEMSCAEVLVCAAASVPEEAAGLVSYEEVVAAFVALRIGAR